jgi:hypothetical protein
VSITVRKAEQEDTPWLLDQLQQFDKFFGSRRSLFPDLEYAQATLAGLIAEHPFFVAVDARGPVGFIAGVLMPHFLNPSIKLLSELFWWVAEEARGSRAGALLLAAFTQHGRQYADQIVMTLEVDSPIDPASLINRGFRLKEVNYLLEVT